MLEFMSGATGTVVAGSMLFLSGFFVAKKYACSRASDKFDAFIEEMEDGYYRSSLDGKQMYANKALVRLNGYDSQEEMLKSVDDIATEWYVDPKRRDRFSELLHENGSVTGFVSEIYRHKTRERIWISETARLMLTRDGRPSHYEGTIREVSDTVRRLELEKLYRNFAEQVPGVMVQGRWSADGKFSLPFKSVGFERLFGDLDGVVEDDAAFLFRTIHRHDFEKFIDSAKKSAETGKPWELEFRVSCQDGRQLWLDLKAKPQIEGDGSCLWNGFLMDITNKKSADKQIQDLADLDPLTKLLNRNSIMQLMGKARTANNLTKQSAALLLIDLDEFKSLNDKFGHAAGDGLLLAVSDRLASAAGDNAAIARVGSDEFAILLEGLSQDADIAMKHVDEIASRILKKMKEPFEIEDEMCRLGASMGSVLVNYTETPGDDLFKAADVALRISKLDGKNRHTVFNPDLVPRLQASIKAHSKLKMAS